MYIYAQNLTIYEATHHTKTVCFISQILCGVKRNKKLELLLTGFQTYDRLTGNLNINFRTCSWGACFLFPWYWHVRPFLLVIRILSCGPSWQALTSTLFGLLDFVLCALGTEGLSLSLCGPRPDIHERISIPHICHFFSTGTIFGSIFLHAKARKSYKNRFRDKTA